jgi:eukaryotic-like serine/threonine-protein kinase
MLLRLIIEPTSIRSGAPSFRCSLESPIYRRQCRRSDYSAQNAARRSYGLSVLLAAGLGFAYMGVVAKPRQSQREPFVTSIERLLRELRLGGKSEQVLQRFVAENSGKGWKELFSTLFGYDEMRRQRRMMRDQQKLAGKNQFGRFRDLVADRLDLQIENLRRNQERRMLKKLEKKRLKARGLSDSDARQQAAALAATMVGAATEVRKSMADFSLDASVENAVARRERIKAMMAQARTGKTQTSQFSMARGLSWLLPCAMFRFLLGGALLTLCGLWARQNDLLSSEQIQRVSSMAKEASQSIQQSGTANLKTLGTSVLDNGTSQPLNLPVVGQYFNSFAPGVPGLMILLSAAISGWRLCIFAIAAAALTLLLPVYVTLPEIRSFRTGPWIALAAGIVIMAAGWLMCRRRAR